MFTLWQYDIGMKHGSFEGELRVNMPGVHSHSHFRRQKDAPCIRIHLYIQ